MPVLACSFAWYSASHACPSLAMSRSSSSSALQPGAMKPPSTSITGGSSAIDRSIKSTIAGCWVSCAVASLTPVAPSSPAISGMGRSDAASALRSRGFARMALTFAIRRSRSRTPLSSTLSCASEARFVTNAPTESSLALTSAERAKGRAIQLRSALAPIGVLVTSRTPRSEASFETSPPGRS